MNWLKLWYWLKRFPVKKSKKTPSLDLDKISFEQIKEKEMPVSKTKWSMEEWLES